MVERAPQKPKMPMMSGQDIIDFLKTHEKEIKEKYQKMKKASGSPLTEEETAKYYSGLLAQADGLKTKEELEYLREHKEVIQENFRRMIAEDGTPATDKEVEDFFNQLIAQAGKLNLVEDDELDEVLPTDETIKW